MDHKKIKIFSLILIGMGFIFWAIKYIQYSSFIAIDHHRYYCLADDAMISMRYAWNLSHGMGLVWNSGMYVEGFSNLLMTLIMSLFTFLADKTTSVLCIQIMGIILMLVIGYFSIKISEYTFNNSLNALSIPFFVLTFTGIIFYYPLVIWSLTGMETGLLTALFLAALYSSLQFVKRGNFRVLPVIAFLTGMMFLTRNESIMLSGIIWGMICWNINKKKYSKKHFHTLVISLGMIFIFIAGQLSFQYFYYGELLPNTYNLKLTGLPFMARISDGISYTKPFVFEIWFPLLLLFIDLLINFKKIKVYLLSFYLAALIYQIYIGGDAWNLLRIPAPAMPLIILLFTGASAG